MNPHRENSHSCQEPAQSPYSNLKWRDLYALVSERRLLGARSKTEGQSKEVLKRILIDADNSTKQPEGAAQTASGSSGSGGDGSKLNQLLNPRKKSKDWVNEASAGDKGEIITDMFLNVDKAGSNQRANPKQFEEDSRDGVLPSVAVDKFLQAAQVMGSNPLAVLLGHECKFGKGSGSFKRSVITTMLCGSEEQLTHESRLP